MEDRADTAWSTFLFGTLWVLFVILIKWKRYAIKTTILFHSFETQLQWQNKHEEENKCENCSSAFLFGKHNLLVHKTKNHKAYLNIQCKIIWHNVNVWLKVSSSRFSKKTHFQPADFVVFASRNQNCGWNGKWTCNLNERISFHNWIEQMQVHVMAFLFVPFEYIYIYISSEKTGSWVVTWWVFPVKFSSMTWVLHKNQLWASERQIVFPEMLGCWVALVFWRQAFEGGKNPLEMWESFF